MAKVPELVLSKKDELVPLMLERSATKGYHLAFRRRPDLDQEGKAARRKKSEKVRVSPMQKSILLMQKTLRPMRSIRRRRRWRRLICARSRRD